MRRTSLALLAAGALGLGAIQSGYAADMGLPVVKAPVPVAPVFSWTGFYIGANGGAGWGTTESTANVGQTINAALVGTGAPPVSFNLPIASSTFNGFLAGGQVGYNWQTGVFVLGLEGDFDWMNMQGNAPCVVVFACTVTHNWEGDITARLGVAAFDRALVYLKGGVAWEQANYSLGNALQVGALSFAANASASTTQVGGLLGMGIEYAFLPNWSAKIEYNFIDFGSHTVNFPITTVPAVPGVVGAALAAGTPVSINEFQHIIKAGVNYRF